jgi:hypothetical protein
MLTREGHGTAYLERTIEQKKTYSSLMETGSRPPPEAKPGHKPRFFLPEVPARVVAKATSAGIPSLQGGDDVNSLALVTIAASLAARGSSSAEGLGAGSIWTIWGCVCAYASTSAKKKGIVANIWNVI